MWTRAIIFGLMLASCAVAGGQTIQLPSFSRVGVNTTVVVPDSGTAYLKRDRRAATQSSRFGGLPRHRGWSIRRQAPGMGITAQIHHPLPVDPGLAGAASNTASAARRDAPPQLVIDAGRAAADAPSGSVAELKQRRAAQAAGQNREALENLEKGRRARDAGKTSVAVIYYRSAARQANGALRQQILAELDAISGPSGQDSSAAAGQTATRPTTRTARSDP